MNTDKNERQKAIYDDDDDDDNYDYYDEVKNRKRPSR